MWSRYSQCLFPLLYMLSLYFDSYLGDLVMVTEKKLNWTMSVNNCSSYGMELLQPKNETVMLDLKYFLNTSIAQNRTIDEIWIGLKYDTASESYYWQDGSSLLIDTYWMGNVKEKEKEKKLCVKIVVETLLWNIENCSTPHTYICQRDDDADSLPDSPDVVIFQPTEPPASITSSRDDKNSEGLLLWQPDEDEVVSTLVVGVAICFVAITIGFLGWKYFLHDWFDNMAQRPSPRNDITSESELLRRSFGVTSAESYTK